MSLKWKFPCPPAPNTSTLITRNAELRGLYWSLHGSIHQTPTSTTIDVQLDFTPIDKTIWFKCGVSLNFRHDTITQSTKTFTIDSKSTIIPPPTNFTITMVGPPICYYIDITLSCFEFYDKRGLFESNKFTDMVLSVGDKKLYACKQILALQSKKFYEMIYSSDKEVDQITITDMDYGTFLKFLSIMHGYDCEPVDDLHEFTQLSLIYDCQRCMDYCSKQYDTVSSCTFRYQLTDKNSTFLINGIPFKSYQSTDTLSIECLIMNDNWEVITLIESTQKSIHAKFTSDRRIWSIESCSEDTIYFSIESCYRLYQEENNDFNIPRDNLTDIVLSVGDKKFYVSKQILANSSTYFNNMFYGGYREQNQTDIPLIGIDKNDFEEFLQHVYSPKRDVKESTLDSLLELSHYYDAYFIHKKCVKYILLARNINNVQKIQIAVNHDLEDLFNQLAANIKTKEEFEEFSQQDGFNELDSKTIAAIKKSIPQN